MNEIEIYFDGEKGVVGPNEIWVHLQSFEHEQSHDLVILIPASLVEKVFDPEGERGEKSLEEFVKQDIDELGTFIVEGYMDNIVQLCGSGGRRFKWVLANVDSIAEKEGRVEMHCVLIPLCQDRI